MNPMPVINASRFSTTGRSRGFTAIEIAMVATVISIFALIVLPIFRNRVDEAKLAAAQSDLTSFYKALTLSQADSGFFVRLEDLAAVQENTPTTVPPTGVTNETPIFAYPVTGNWADRRVFTEDEWRAFGRKEKWKGPYVTFQRHIPLGDLQNDALYSPFLRSRGSQPDQRPIQDIETGQLRDSVDKRIPTDPWGNPYLFFPPDRHTPQGGTETGYASSWLVSLGPDGLPGNGSTDPDDYLRIPGTQLGTENDLKVEF